MNQDFRVSYNALRKIYSQEAYSNIAMNEALEDGKNCSPGFVRYVVKEILRKIKFIATPAGNQVEG